MVDVKKLFTKIMQLNSSTLTIKKGTAGQNWCRKRNGMVEFFLDLANLSYASGWNTVATLPSGWEPKEYYDFPCLNVTTDQATSAKVTSSGDVQIFKSSYAGDKMRIHSTHFAKWGGVLRNSIIVNRLTPCGKVVAAC